MDASPSPLEGRDVLVVSSSVVTVDDVESIRWYFEGPRVGGSLRPNGIVFVDDRSFILNFCSSLSSGKILSKTNHYVTIGDEEIEMTVQPCPLDVAAKCTGKDPPVMTDAHDNRDDSFSLSASKRIDIVPDECHFHLDQPLAYSSDQDVHSSRRLSVPSMEWEEEGILPKRIKLETVDSEMSHGQELHVKEKFTGNAADNLGTSLSDSDVRRRTIQVLDVPSYVVDVLLLYLESKTDGGELEVHSYDKENHVFVATFVDRNVAERFVSRGSILVKEFDLQISALPEMVQSEDRLKEEEIKEEKFEPPSANTVEVKDLRPELTSDILRLYFENQKRSGGGSVDEIQIFPTEERALVKFIETEAAARVIDRAQHSVLGIPIRCLAAGRPVVGALSCAIEVRWSGANLPEEMLSLFFENHKRSGGGPAEDFYYSAEDCRAVITFHSHEVVERILQNHQRAPMVLNNVRLMVTSLLPALFLPCFADDIELDKILIHDIPCDSSKDDLVRYLQRGAATSILKLRYSLRRGTAMAYFDKAFDYGCLRDLVSTRPFCGVMLSIQKVPASHSIQVFNVGDLSIDYLMLYFENPKSGGGEILEGEMHAKENFAILKFANKEVISSIVLREHKLVGRLLSVSEYHEGLGIMPPEVDDESHSWWLPSNLMLACELQKVNFIMSSPRLKTQIESIFEPLYCRVEWPVLKVDEDPTASCSVILHCMLSRNTEGISHLAKTWTGMCRDKMIEELDGVLFEEIIVLQELWGAVSDRMKPLENSVCGSDNVRIVIDSSSCTVRILGVRQFCNDLAESFKAIVSQAEMELEKEKPKVTEQIQKLKCYQFEILSSIGFLESSADDGVDVTVKGTDIAFRGQPGDILAKKLKMYEILNSVINESLDLPDFVLDSLTQPPFCSHIASCLQEKNVVSAWELKSKGLTVYGLDQSEIDRTASVLKSEVIQRQLLLGASEASALLLPEWASFKASMENDFGAVAFRENESSLQVTSTGGNMHAVLEVVQNFIKENAIKEEFLMTKRGTACIVSQYLKAELKTICSDFSSYRVTIKEDLDASHAGFVITGTVFGLQSALNKVVELSNKVIEKERLLDRPGMSNYLRSARGQKQIEAIQSRHRVFIEDWEDVNKINLIFVESRKFVTIHDVDTGLQPQVLDEVRLKDSVIVKVVLGDITEYKVEAIVNAANGQLDHHGGVAKVIVDKGGPKIQTECKDYVKSKGSLLPGHVFVSKPGSLPCKYIIHAVGPIWEHGLKNEENILSHTIYNVLTEAEALKIKSVAMPAISTGLFGFPVRKAARVTLEAVADFVEKETPASLREVHIIDNNRNSAEVFKDVLARYGTPSQRVRRKCEAERPIVIDDDDDDDDDEHCDLYSLVKSEKPDQTLLSYLQPVPAISSLPGNSLSTEHSHSSVPSAFPARSQASTAPLLSSSVSSNVLTTPQGLKVTLIKGSIVGQAVDVIVNTTSYNLALNYGAVSNLILQTAGPSIQKECLQKAPNGLGCGQVVVTLGYNLPCKFVYHGYCLSWDNGNGPCEQSIRSLLKAIYLEAHNNSVTSIAIPAVGTGNLKVPCDLVARIMYEQVEEFSQSYQGTTLRDVCFVVYDKDLPTVAAFENELHFPKRGAKQKGKKSIDRILARSKSLPAETSKSAGGVGILWSISLGTVKLEVIEGDITQATTDAIVNIASENLHLKQGAVSAAILRVGGHEIQDECNIIGKMSDGMAITGAGKLPSKFIFHLKAHVTERGWKRGIENCLAAAERQRIQSITFPLIGTGNIRAPVKVMASLMLDSVLNFSTKSNPQHLRHVRIAIFQHHMVEEFVQAINKMALHLQMPAGESDHRKVSLFALPDKSPAIKSHSVREFPQQKVRKFDETIRLIIYGLSEKALESAYSELDDLCSDVIQDKVIDKETIAKLSADQIERIKTLELEFSTKISVEQGHRLNRIRVQGEGHTIVSVVDKIYTIFEEVEAQEREEYHADVVAKQAQWIYQCDDSYDPYPKPINLIIEKAFQGSLPYVEWEEEDGSYRLDFHRMEETKNQDVANRIKVKRMKAESTIPKGWEAMNTDEQCRRVPLSPTSQEYQDVLNNVKATAGGIFQQILTIERIQNPSLYQQYMVRKDAMEMILQNTNTGSTILCERILWHGTSADTLESINRHGFNRSYCGKNAVAYGKGVYFALNFHYSGSNTYAVPDSSGRKHVYQSRVLTGEFTVGSQSYFVAPAKPGSTVARYDSVVDNPAVPSIFVIFSDTQAYPEYLIVFK